MKELVFVVLNDMAEMPTVVQLKKLNQVLLRRSGEKESRSAFYGVLLLTTFFNWAVLKVHALRRGPFLSFKCLSREGDIECGGLCFGSGALIDKDAVKRPAVHVQGHIGDREGFAVNTQDRAIGKYILKRLQADILPVRGDRAPADLVVGVCSCYENGGLSGVVLLSSGVLVNLRCRG